MIKFIYQSDEGNFYVSDPIESIEIQTSSVDRQKLLDTFKYFLLACGYSVNGEIIVEAPDEPDDDSLNHSY